jgi:hypothetical protein
LKGVHQQIPEEQIGAPGYTILAPPSDAVPEQQTSGPPSYLATDADKLRQMYKEAGDEQKHVFGEGIPGSRPPDFTKIPGVKAAPAPGQPGAVSGSAQSTVSSAQPSPSVSPVAPPAPKTIPPAQTLPANNVTPAPGSPAPTATAPTVPAGNPTAVPPTTNPAKPTQPAPSQSPPTQ